MKNKRKIAKQLENFLEEELQKNIPVSVLPDKSIAYKNYRVKPKADGSFDLHYGGIGFERLEKFNLKACALMAAKRHDRVQMEGFKEIIDLDRKYWSNYADTKYFEQKIKITKDIEKYCILHSRLDLSKHRAENYKEKIQSLFKMSFA
jgi:hypothetical protein